MAKKKRLSVEKIVVDVEKDGNYIVDVLEKLEPQGTMVARTLQMMAPWEVMDPSNCRTFTVIANEVSWKKDGKRKTYKMEVGRNAAQVGHAVSKLKMSYILRSTVNCPETAFGFVGQLQDWSITSIVLKARDSEELEHIYKLCDKENIHAVRFEDTNSAIYGLNTEVLTAVSIGPIESHKLIGITDYLPLWQESCDTVR